jgi:hypothetical protein
VHRRDGVHVWGSHIPAINLEFNYPIQVLLINPKKSLCGLLYSYKSQFHYSCSTEEVNHGQFPSSPARPKSSNFPRSMNSLWPCTGLCSPICCVIILHAGLFTYPHGIVVHHRAAIKSNSIPQTVGVISGRACIDMLSLWFPFSLKCCGTAKDFAVVLNFSHIRLKIRCCKSLTEKGRGLRSEFTKSLYQHLRKRSGSGPCNITATTSSN